MASLLPIIDIVHIIEGSRNESTSEPTTGNLFMTLNGEGLENSIFVRTLSASHVKNMMCLYQLLKSTI